MGVLSDILMMGLKRPEMPEEKKHKKNKSKEQTMIVYIRNITTFLAIGVLGLFLIAWCAFASEEDEDAHKWNFFRFVSILTIVVFVANGLYSFSVIHSQYFKGFYVISS